MSDTTIVISHDRVPVPASELNPAFPTPSSPVESGAASPVLIGLREVRTNVKVRAYIEKANEQIDSDRRLSWGILSRVGKQPY